MTPEYLTRQATLGMVATWRKCRPVERRNMVRKARTILREDNLTQNPASKIGAWERRALRQFLQMAEAES